MGAVFEVRGVEELVRQLDQFDNPELDKRMKKALLAGARELRKEIVRQAPEKTGTLKRSIRAKALRDRPGMPPAAVVGPRRSRTKRLRERTAQGLRATDWAPHAHLVIAGTKAHAIRARGKRALRIPGLGGVHFVREIVHPGADANPFVERAIRAAEGRALDAVRRTFEK